MLHINNHGRRSLANSGRSLTSAAAPGVKCGETPFWQTFPRARPSSAIQHSSFYLLPCAFCLLPCAFPVVPSQGQSNQIKVNQGESSPALPLGGDGALRRPRPRFGGRNERGETCIFTPRSTFTSCSNGFFCQSWFASQPSAIRNLSMKSLRTSDSWQLGERKCPLFAAKSFASVLTTAKASSNVCGIAGCVPSDGQRGKQEEIKLGVWLWMLWQFGGVSFARCWGPVCLRIRSAQSGAYHLENAVCGHTAYRGFLCGVGREFCFRDNAALSRDAATRPKQERKLGKRKAERQKFKAESRGQRAEGREKREEMLPDRRSRSGEVRRFGDAAAERI